MSREVPVQSVKKALDLLSVLAFEDLGRRGIPLTVLARRMAMRANSAHNLLKTMVACGYVVQTESGTYAVGPRCIEMGRINTLVNVAGSQVVRERMEQVCRELGEAVTFAVLAGGRRVLLRKADTSQVVRVDSSALETRSLFAVPTGRVLAAFAAPDDLAQILEQSGLPAADWNDIRSRPPLEEALATIRKQGHETIVPDGRELASFAVPVFDGQGQLLGALGCYAPMFRCGPEKHGLILANLRRAAEEIRQRL